MKQVKIIGLSVSKDFGGLKACELAFNQENRLTLIKGEVGSGKTTLNRAMRLTTQGSSTLTDKNLYGEVDLTTQLTDGQNQIFVGCKTNKLGTLDYFLYAMQDGKKINQVVVDGKKLTPASYLESLQTALTWRLDELTSENPTTQRNILLELYQKELELQGVYFDKNHPKYTEGIIHKIEKAKNHRSLMDMRRKEVGGIAEDLRNKGVSLESRMVTTDVNELTAKRIKIESEISLLSTNVEQQRTNKLNEIKVKALEVVSEIKDINNAAIKHNESIDLQKVKIDNLYAMVDELIDNSNRNQLVKDTIKRNLPELGKAKKLIEFEDGKIVSKAKDFEHDEKMFSLLTKHREYAKAYKRLKNEDTEIDDTELQKSLKAVKDQIEFAEQKNKEAIAVNAYHDWKDSNDDVNALSKDYYKKLTSINTGVEGLKICVEPNGSNDNIYLMYDGSYDTKYFNNPDKELRKLSSYSGTQKPMICLLIQNYLLKQKPKALPYLWIDDIPLDAKTRILLEQMAKELDLWLFVNWTGDFSAKELKDGEILRLFKQGKKHVLGQSATGSGKTVMFSYIAKKTSEKNKKVLIITDRTELLFQAGGTIEKFQMNPFYIKAGIKFVNTTKSVYIAMAQTLRNRITDKKWFEFIKNKIDLVIIDEAHIQEFNYLFESGVLKDKYVIGFTATPVRSGKMTQLGLQYEAMAKGKPINWLIKNGYLVNCDIYECGSPDLSQVKINKMKGDFSENSMFQSYNSSKLYKGLVRNYKKHTPGQKMIVFCCNVDHAIKTTRSLIDAGVRAKFLSSKKEQPKEPLKWTDASKAMFDERFNIYKEYVNNFHELSGERDDIIKAFRNNEFEVLVNVDIATKGFDVPDIEVVALYRATMSLALYLQMLGRGGRIAENKTHFTVFDFGENKERFGGYDLDRDWSLWHEETKPGSGIPPMKVCGESANGEMIKGDGEIKKGCGRMILAAYKICPFCGFKYPDRNKAQEVELELSKIVDENGVSIKQKSFKDMSYDELYAYRKIKHHHINWVWNILWSRGGASEIEAYGMHHKYTKHAIKRAIEYCEQKYL